VTVPDPPRIRRPRPSPAQLAARRIGALVLLVGGLAVLAFVIVHFATRSKHHAAPAPRVVGLRIIFPEGFTRAQMADRITAVDAIARHKRHVNPRLSAHSYLAATAPRVVPGFGPKKLALEGFLFPALYEFLPKTTAKELVNKQLSAFRAHWAKVDLTYARSKNLTPYDVLTIASMIEKEAIAPSDRPLVAAVIYNRLHLGMTIGIDAAIRYGDGIPPGKEITSVQLHKPGPYNTRLNTTLPPTPISNPGLPSMQAAAHPAHVKYLYFVTKPDKVHFFFTDSLAAFNTYKAQHPSGVP
jgi:uncharacterized YceG family protein